MKEKYKRIEENKKNLGKFALASFAILSSGLILSAGNNIFQKDENKYELTKESKLSEEGVVKFISSGEGDSSAVINDGTSDHFYIWGRNDHGQLGLGDNENRIERNYTPNEVDINGDGIYGNEGTIKQASLGSYHSSVVTNDGTNDHLFTWGQNNYGQLGLGDNDEDNEVRNYTPSEVDINGDGIYGNEGTIKQVSLGTFHSSIVTNDGTNDHLYTWGVNASGQLGLGDNQNNIERNFTPTEVDINGDGIYGNEGTIKQVSLGGHSSVITNDGTNDHLYTWGLNIRGQLGLGDKEHIERNFSPSEVDINKDGIYGNEGTIKQVSLGGYFSSVVTNDGSDDHLYTWGDNSNGQLGLDDNDQDVERNFTPTEVDINGDGIYGNEGAIKQVSLGYNFSSMVINDGESEHLYTWGRNAQGALGLGDDQVVPDRDYTPNEVDINGDGIYGNEGAIKQVSLGAYHALVFTNDGTSDYLYTWGDNVEGSLGLGDNQQNIERNFSPNKLIAITEPNEENENTSIIIISAAIIGLLILLLLLLILLLKRKVKIVDCIKADDQTLLIKFNKKDKLAKSILKKELTLYSRDEELSTSVMIESDDEEYSELEIDKNEYIKVENLSTNKIYNKLSFKYNDSSKSKTWRKVKGKFSIKKELTRDEQKERNKLRQEVLEKEKTAKDISFQDIFGVGPKTEEYFIENGYNTPHSILKIKTYNDKYFDLIDNIPALNSSNYDKKAWMIESFKEEIRYMIDSISSK